MEIYIYIYIPDKARNNTRITFNIVILLTRFSMRKSLEKN